MDGTTTTEDKDIGSIVKQPPKSWPWPKRENWGGNEFQQNRATAVILETDNGYICTRVETMLPVPKKGGGEELKRVHCIENATVYYEESCGHFFVYKTNLDETFQRIGRPEIIHAGNIKDQERAKKVCLAQLER